MSIVRVAVHAHSRVDNRRIGKRGKGRSQKFAQTLFVFRGHHPLGGLGRHLPSRTVISNFHYAIAINRKSVVAGRGNVCAENRKTLRRKQLGLRRPQGKHWLPSRAEKCAGKGQQVRCPRADRHHDEIGGKTCHPERSRGSPRNCRSPIATGFARNDSVAIPPLKYYPSYAIVVFI